MPRESAVGTLATLPDASLPERHLSGTRRHTLQALLFERLRAEQRVLVSADARRVGGEAPRILALAQSAFRDFEALLIGRPAALLDELRDGDWTLRDLLRHVISVELRYAAQVDYAITRGDDEPIRIPEERLPCDARTPPAQYADSATGDLTRLLELIGRARAATDESFADTADALLDRPTMWGALETSARERLHQVGAHLIEATIQAEKMLHGEGSNEARRILRRLRSIRGLHERRSSRALLDRLDAELRRTAQMATGTQ